MSKFNDFVEKWSFLAFSVSMLGVTCLVALFLSLEPKPLSLSTRNYNRNNTFNEVLSNDTYAVGFAGLGQTIIKKNGVWDTLAAVNVQRVYAELTPFERNDVLQEHAEKMAKLCASEMNLSLYNSERPGGWRYAGVGSRPSSYKVWDVYAQGQMSSQYKTAGCASAQGTNGNWYHVIYLR